MFMNTLAICNNLGGGKPNEPVGKRFRRAVLSVLRRPYATVVLIIFTSFFFAALSSLRPDLSTLRSSFAAMPALAPGDDIPSDHLAGSKEGQRRGGSARKENGSSLAGKPPAPVPEKPIAFLTEKRLVGVDVVNRASGGAGGVVVKSGFENVSSADSAGYAPSNSFIEHSGSYAFSVAVVIPGARTTSPYRLSGLLDSVSSAVYPTGAVVTLNVHVVDDGTPASLAAAVGSQDEEEALVELEAVTSKLEWRHGPRSFAIYESMDAWINVMQATPSVVIFSDIAGGVSKAYPDFLKRAMRVASGSDLTPKQAAAMGAPILAVSLDSLISAGLSGKAGGPIPQEKTARTGLFFPGTSAFAPTEDSWNLFLKWRRVRGKRVMKYTLRGGFPMETIGSRPTTNLPLSDLDIREQYAEFVHLYGGNVLHPVVQSGDLLVDRDPANAVVAGATDRIPWPEDVVALDGASVPPSDKMTKPLRLQTRTASQTCCELYRKSTLWTYPVSTDPVMYTLSGTSEVGERLVPVGTSKISILPSWANSAMVAEEKSAEEMKSDKAHADAVRKMAAYAHKRGGGVLSFTLVTDAFVETTYSWICNVLAVGALPRALVFGASSAAVVRDLEALFMNDTRVARDDVLVVDLSNAIHAVDKSPTAGLDFGSSEYWQLMLERTALLRDVLDAGVGILHFETDQIWFGSPMKAIDSAVVPSDDLNGQAGVPDMVITINTRGEASGNFFLLRPTQATRHLWSLVTEEFLESYRKSLNTKEAKKGQWHYIQNDQSLFTRYGLGKEKWYNDNFPVARYAVLDKQRFVDGTWYLDFEDEKGGKVVQRTHYTSAKSLEPIVLNNNFMIGVDGKKKRAQRFSHWFWDEAVFACSSKLGNGTGQTRVRAAPQSYL